MLLLSIVVTSPPVSSGAEPPDPLDTITGFATNGLVTSVTAGLTHLCAISNGQIACWGKNNYGQLGNATNSGTATPNPTPMVVTGLPAGTAATAVDAGYFHTCALLNTGQVACWGDNEYGQVGKTANLGTGIANPVPTLVTGLPAGTTAVAIDTGPLQTCAVLDTGQVACWGRFWTPGVHVVAGLPAGAAAVAVTSGDFHTCALLNTGEIACWGDSFFGQLGPGVFASHGSMGLVSGQPAGTTAVAIAAGVYHTCALLNTGQVVCWGGSRSFALGHTNTVPAGMDLMPTNPNPTVVAGLPGGIVAIDADGSQSCALSNGGQIYCWGANLQVGLGAVTGNYANASPTPTLVAQLPVGSYATGIANGYYHMCALLNTGPMACWGSNEFGQLGHSGNLSSTNANPIPTVVAGLPVPTFVALNPVRVMDTRAGSRAGNASGTSAPLTLSLFGVGGLPSDGIGAVALNVTVTDTENPTIGGGYVTVYPCGTRPEASNLNFTTGQTIPNAVIAPVSAAGTVCFHVYGTAHLIADLSGYFPTGRGFNSLTPARVVDTRTGAKIGNPAGTGTPLTLSVINKGGLPDRNIGAVALNVTVTDTENPTIGGGYVTVYPCGTRPEASNLNFTTGQTVANTVIAPVSATGTVCFYIYGTAHLIADVAGYFPTDIGFTSLDPVRVLDTRIAGTKVGNADGTGTPLRVAMFDNRGLPASGFGAVALNVTVTDTENPTIGDGYVTVYPCGTRPEASNLNFTTGQAIPNAVIAPVSATGGVCFYVYGTAHVIADASGHFAS